MIGSRPNNILLDFLKCYTKVQAKKNVETQALSSNGGGVHVHVHDNDKDTCRSVEKSYNNFHLSVIGTGNYNGHKQCGDQLQDWLECYVITKGRTQPR